MLFNRNPSVLVLVCKRTYQYIQVHTSVYWYVQLYDRFVAIHMSMYAYERFEVSSKKVQTDLELKTFCMHSSSVEHTTTLQEYRLQRRQRHMQCYQLCIYCLCSRTYSVFAPFCWCQMAYNCPAASFYAVTCLRLNLDFPETSSIRELAPYGYDGFI